MRNNANTEKARWHQDKENLVREKVSFFPLRFEIYLLVLGCGECAISITLRKTNKAEKLPSAQMYVANIVDSVCWHLIIYKSFSEATAN